MCSIKKVEAWAFGDKTFDHEIDATKAAIEHLIGNAGVSKIIFEKADKLLPLLDRFAELQMYDQAGKAAPETAGKDPAAMSPAEVRDLLAATFRSKAKGNKIAMQAVIRDAGYADLSDLIDRASDMHVNALLAKLMGVIVNRVALDAQGHTVSCRARATGFEADCRCGVLILNRSLYTSDNGLHGR